VDTRTATVGVVAATSSLTMRLVSGFPNLRITGPTGTTVQVYYTSDFSRWTNLTNVFQEQDPLIIVDYSATNATSRFYRVSP
jgi:hypothetical protein